MAFTSMYWFTSSSTTFSYLPESFISRVFTIFFDRSVSTDLKLPSGCAYTCRKKIVRPVISKVFTNIYGFKKEEGKNSVAWAGKLFVYETVLTASGPLFIQ